MPGPEKVLRCLGDYVNHYARKNSDSPAIVPFGQTIAFGFLTLSLVAEWLTMWAEAGDGVAALKPK